jgi:peptidoglycan/LPS O-acetylase OafA/YrhL
MALEDDDEVRRLLAGRPRPQLSGDFSRELMRRVRQQHETHERQRGVGTRLVLGVYWLAALVATAWILRQGPLPEWLAALLWAGALLLVPAGYALVLWTSMGGLAKREREV